MMKLGKFKIETRPDTAHLNVAIKDLRVKHSQLSGSQKPALEHAPSHAEGKKKLSNKEKIRMLEQAKEAELKSIARGLTRPTRSISLIPVLRFPSHRIQDFVNTKGSKTERTLRPDFRSLHTTVFDSLLDVADISNNFETLNMTAPALGALASKKGNRVVLTEAGSVEILMKLVDAGPPSVKLDAWLALDDLLRCNDAKKKLFAQPGILDKLQACATSRNHRLRRVGASILRNLISERALSVQEKTAEEMIQAICRFVTCGEEEASVSAGNALFRIAKCSTEEKMLWPVASLQLLGEVVSATHSTHSASFSSLDLSFLSNRCAGRRDCAHALVTLTSHKKSRVAMSGDTKFVEIALRALIEHSKEVASGAWCNHLLQAAEVDEFLLKTIAQLLTSVSGTSLANLDDDRSNDTLRLLEESMSRINEIMQEVLPSQRSLVCIHDADEIVLPQEAELQLNFTLIISRLSLCTRSARHVFLQCCSLPLLVDLCLCTQVRTAQNAASAIFYIAHEERALDYFLNHPVGNPGNQEALRRKSSFLGVIEQTTMTIRIQDMKTSRPLKEILKIVKQKPNALVELALLKTVRKLVSMVQGKNIVLQRVLDNTDAVNTLAVVLASTQQDLSRTIQKNRYIMLKNAIMAADLLSLILDMSGPDRDVTLSHWIGKMIEHFVRNHNEIAVSIISTTPNAKLALQRHLNDEHEFANIFAHKEPESDSDADKKKIKQLFLTYDTERTGSITADDLHAILHELGHICMRDEALRIMAEVDVNGDGAIQLRELLQWWKFVHCGEF